MVSAFPAILVNSWRSIQGLDTIPPREDMGHAENILYMLDVESTRKNIKDFESALILHMDDPENPSLSALCSTLIAGGHSTNALRAALEKHTHPLHHGAGSHAMRMVYELRDTGDVRTALEARIANGNRIFGLGHRIYRTIDPRARYLRAMLNERTRDTDLEWLPKRISEIATEGAEILHQTKRKVVFPNVDLYNAAVYLTLGIDPAFNTQLFAISRIAGWTAHITEWRRFGHCSDSND